MTGSMPSCHPLSKRGVCDSCNTCFYCKPLPKCRKKKHKEEGGPGEYRRRFGKATRSTGMAITSTRVRRTEAALQKEAEANTTRVETPSNALPFTGTISPKARARAKKVKLLHDFRDAPPSPKSDRTYSESSKTPFQELMQLLGKSKQPSRVPKNGLTPNLREFRRNAKSIMNAVAAIACPSDPAAFLANAVPSRQPDLLEENISKLALCGSPFVKWAAKSALSMSMSYVQMNALLTRTADRLDLQNQPNTISHRTYNKAARLFTKFGSGNEPSIRKDYKFRVSENKLADAVQYIQTAFPFRPAFSRNVSMFGHTFEGMPVYERGETTVRDAYKGYTTNREEPIGYKLFASILYILTLPGESKTGLSSYFVEFLHVRNVISEMITTIESDEPEDAAKLVQKWKEAVQFLKRAFSHDHMQFSSECVFHCAENALGHKCTHKHHKNCAECASAFGVLDDIEDFVTLNLPDCRQVVKLARDAFFRYAAHKTREFWQKSKIDSVKKELLNDTSHLLIVIDHKQKILPAAHREPQNRYFGKRGKLHYSFSICI